MLQEFKVFMRRFQLSCQIKSACRDYEGSNNKILLLPLQRGHLARHMGKVTVAVPSQSGQPVH